jgi:hypothetical protein
MSEENVHDILERVSTDKSFREQFVIALGAKKKNQDCGHDLTIRSRIWNVFFSFFSVGYFLLCLSE